MQADRVADPLLAWFDRHGRKDLPWQRNPSPYRVWVSEIMLQQTRVGVVIPYFERFTARFPDVSDLAAADQEEVLHLWSGLGYYARARNLHQAARLVLTDYCGRFPREHRQLQGLPGIGRSTAGAILSLALGQRHPILDANAKRVLARCFAVPGWPGRRETLERLWSLAEACTPGERVRDYNQAIMDLGATLCTSREPGCVRCPLAHVCRAQTLGKPLAFPEPKPRKTLPVRATRMLVVRNPAGAVLLERRPPIGIWGGLYSLPECGVGQEPGDWCRQRLGILPSRVEKLPTRRHSFSHFHLDIRPLQLDVPVEHPGIGDGNSTIWCDPQRPIAVGIAAPVTRILHEVTVSNRHHIEG